jgi:putative hemin transport protein
MSTASSETLKTDSGLTAEQIAERWAMVLVEQPKTRIRDAAAVIGVSEAELLATRCGKDVVRLEGDWGQMIAEMEPLGEVMALTRNDFAVSEKVGRYRNVEIFKSHVHMGQVLDEGIDLRLFLNHWRLGFAVREETERGLRRSLQFFDTSGAAVHKTYLREQSDAAGFDSLVERFRSSDQTTTQSVEAKAPTPPETPDSEIDIPGFQNAWRGLKDTHDFIMLTRRFGVSRTQALRLAEPEMAWRVQNSSFRIALEFAAGHGGKIMVFVSNPGCIQIHSGPIQKVQVMGDWLNVLDPGFNLHIQEPGIDQAWVVRKPTVRGVVTGVEFFDARGQSIAILHAKRVEGDNQPEFWPTMCEGLPRI